MTNEEFEPVRIRIMKEAYDLADKNDTEGYNSVKAMCGDVQTLLQRQWVSLTDDEILDIVGRAGAGYPAAEQCGLWKALDEWSGEFGNGDVEQDGKPMLNDFVEAIIKECARFGGYMFRGPIDKEKNE